MGGPKVLPIAMLIPHSYLTSKDITDLSCTVQLQYTMRVAVIWCLSDRAVAGSKENLVCAIFKVSSIISKQTENV